MPHWEIRAKKNHSCEVCQAARDAEHDSSPPEYIVAATQPQLCNFLLTSAIIVIVDADLRTKKYRETIEGDTKSNVQGKKKPR